jgi:hypothetical protein
MFAKESKLGLANRLGSLSALILLLKAIGEAHVSFGMSSRAGGICSERYLVQGCRLSQQCTDKGTTVDWCDFFQHFEAMFLIKSQILGIGTLEVNWYPFSIRLLKNRSKEFSTYSFALGVRVHTQNLDIPVWFVKVHFLDLRKDLKGLANDSKRHAG